MARWTRVAGAVAALALGGCVAVCTVLLHDRWWGWLLGVAATAALVAAVPAGWWRRLPVTVGWAVTVGWLATPRAAGDYLVSADLPGYLLLAAAVALPLVGVLTAVPGRPGPVSAPRAPEDPEPPSSERASAAP